MAAPHLSAVPNTIPATDAVGEVFDLGRDIETSAQRIRRLQHEAHVLAHEQLDAFARDLEQMAQRATEIAEGGEAYPVGARELASRIAEDLAQKSQLMTVIVARTAHD